MIRAIFIAFLLFCATAAPAAQEGIRQITPEEFRALATELAPKVNFFAEVWKDAPDAEFYGGTTRDYLYWIKGRFQKVKSRAEAEQVIRELRALPLIDVRDFIIGDSDVDVITNGHVALDPKHYGITKLDMVSPDILDPATEKGANEIHQGYIPAEKVRLSRDSARSSKGLGDGLREIYEGKLSIHFAPAAEFAKTHYASQKLNHPVLLATRYLRLQAMNYFYTHGGGVPDPAKLEAAMSPDDARRVQAVIDSTLDGKELRPYLEKEQFRKWLNGNVQKAFRSYTNPTAALALLKKFRVQELIGRYEGLEPLNKYVFAKYREPAETQKIHRELGIKGDFYRSPAKEFSDGFLYHGTRSEEDFRAILLQGILPSENGTAGAGLYGVATENRSFSEDWGGDKSRLLRFPVKPDAKIVDITQGEGKRVWDLYSGKHGADLEAFAEAVDADIVKYPYNPDAYVVKNSDALERAEGVYRQVLSFSKALTAAENVRTDEDLFRLRENFNLSRFTAQEVESLIRATPSIGDVPAIRNASLLNVDENFEKLFLGKDAFAKTIREIFGARVLEQGMEQVGDGQGFLRWLRGAFQFYGQPAKLITYGGNNRDLPSFGRLQSRPRELPSTPDITSWIKLAEKRRLLKPANFALLTPKDRQEALQILADTNHLSFPAIERLREAIYEALARPPTALSPAEAYAQVRPLIEKKYYFADLGDLIASLLTLTDSSSLPEPDRQKLKKELIDLHRETAAVYRKVSIPNKGSVPEGWAGIRIWEYFLDSAVMEDHPQLAQRFLLDRADMHINGYVAPDSGTRYGGLDMVLQAEDRQVRLLTARPNLMKRAMQESNLDKKEWVDFFLRRSPYDRTGPMLDRLLGQGWKPNGPLPQAALNALFDAETQKLRLLNRPYDYKELNFFFEHIVAHPNFPQTEGASAWILDLFKNSLPYSLFQGAGTAEAYTKAIPNLLSMAENMSAWKQKQFLDNIVRETPAGAEAKLREALAKAPWASHPRRAAWLEALSETDPDRRHRHLGMMATLKNPSRWAAGCANLFRGLTGRK